MGILVSAPMGPVGVLCIRRTLHSGRKAGILTGVGAMISDIIYAGISYEGVSLILDFIYRYEDILELFGSIVVLAFGIYMFYSIPNYDVQDKVKSNSAAKFLTSSFLLALGNPFIAFVYFAFFNRYHFVPDIPEVGLHFWVSMTSIALGAILWWLFITFLTLRLKAAFSIGGLRIFNKILAIIFFLIGVVGIIIGVIDLI